MFPKFRLFKKFDAKYFKYFDEQLTIYTYQSFVDWSLQDIHQEARIDYWRSVKKNISFTELSSMLCNTEFLSFCWLTCDSKGFFLDGYSPGWVEVTSYALEVNRFKLLLIQKEFNLRNINQFRGGRIITSLILWQNMVLDEAVQVLLNIVFDVRFRRSSHGSGEFLNGCQTVLQKFKKFDLSATSYLKFDCSSYIRSVPIFVLKGCLGKRIKDEAFLSFLFFFVLRKFAANEKESCSLHLADSETGLLENNTLSSTLINILLHEFDVFIENKLSFYFNVGKGAWKSNSLKWFFKPVSSPFSARVVYVRYGLIIFLGLRNVSSKLPKLVRVVEDFRAFLDFKLGFLSDVRDISVGCISFQSVDFSGFVVSQDAFAERKKGFLRLSEQVVVNLGTTLVFRLKNNIITNSAIAVLAPWEELVSALKKKKYIPEKIGDPVARDSLVPWRASASVVQCIVFHFRGIRNQFRCAVGIIS